MRVGQPIPVATPPSHLHCACVEFALFLMSVFTRDRAVNQQLRERAHGHAFSWVDPPPSLHPFLAGRVGPQGAPLLWVSLLPAEACSSLLFLSSKLFVVVPPAVKVVICSLCTSL